MTPHGAALFVITCLLGHARGNREAGQDFIPGQVVFAAADIQVADGGVTSFAVRWGDKLEIVERENSSPSYRVKVRLRDKGMAIGTMSMWQTALQSERPFPRRGEWVQVTRDLWFRSGRVLQRGAPCIVLDASADAGAAGTQLLLVKAVSVSRQAAFDLSVASGDIEPLGELALVPWLADFDEFDPGELAGGLWAGDVVFSLEDITVMESDKPEPATIVGAGDVGMVFSPGLSPEDRQEGRVLVRFEARRDTLEPTYLNVHPTRLSRERPLMQGHLVQLTGGIQPPDAPAISAGTIGSLVRADAAGEGAIVRIGGESFLLHGGYAPISHLYISDDDEQAMRFAELEEMAEALAAAGQHMSIVSLLEQNMWCMLGFDLGVGVSFLGRRGPLRVSPGAMRMGSVRPLLLKYRAAQGEDGTLGNESAHVFNHESMLGDVGRNAPYAAALRRHARGRRALDIGTGPAALWARAALLYGAASVEAVENTERTVRAVMDGFEGASGAVVPAWVALPVAETATASEPEARGHRFSAKLHSEVPGGAAPEFRLYRGLSSDPSLGLSGGYTLLVHEILGDLAGSEGAAAAIADARERGLVAQDCVFVPRTASTMIAPTSPLSMSALERLLHRWGHGGEAEVRLLTRCSARRFPSSAIIADPQPMEIVDFQGGPELVQERVLEFRTRADGYFDGVHLHLFVDLDDDARIDLLEQHNSADMGIDSNWSTMYVRLVDKALWLQAGSRIAVRCHVDLRGQVASYHISVWVGELEGETHVADFSWAGG